MHWTTPLRHEWLLGYKNPLTERLGAGFFRSLPTTPGVYRFYGHFAEEDEILLYVGKAKNLRARLASYRRANPESVSRKILWMIWQTSRIEFELCATERAALLLENKLLRELRPPFNVTNTSPENYVFFAMDRTARGLRFRLTQESPDRSPERTPPLNSEQFFGAFKSRGIVRDAYGAFLRLLWMTTNNDKDDRRYEIPGALLRYRPPNPYEPKHELDPKWHRPIERFFSGNSRALLREITAAMLERSSIPPHFYHRVQNDIETLSDFFRSHCRKNRELCIHFGRKGSFIAQDEIDDWLVVFGTP